MRGSVDLSQSQRNEAGHTFIWHLSSPLPGGDKSRRRLTMYERIVVAIDDSACAQRALGEAVRLAKESGGVVEVLSVVDRGKWPVEGDSGYGLDPEVRIAASVASHVFEAAQKLLQEAGVRGTVRAIDAYGENVPTVLARAADECDSDIIVIVTHGRRGT